MSPPSWFGMCAKVAPRRTGRPTRRLGKSRTFFVHGGNVSLSVTKSNLVTPRKSRLAAPRKMISHKETTRDTAGSTGCLNRCWAGSLPVDSPSQCEKLVEGFWHGPGWDNQCYPTNHCPTKMSELLQAQIGRESDAKSDIAQSPKTQLSSNKTAFPHGSSCPISVFFREVISDGRTGHRRPTR
jgi:hypothetical protein